MDNAIVGKSTLPPGWVQAPAISEKELSGTFWTFGALGGQSYSPFFVLAPDGLIGNYQHPNEDGWQVVDGRLTFVSWRGNPTTIYDLAQVSDGKVNALAGRVLLSGANHYHELRRTDHPKHPLHATPADADRKARFIQSLPRPRRSNLVILRAGEASLHATWRKDGHDRDRTWDLCISYYGADVGNLAHNQEYLTHQPHQRKFQAIYDLFFEGSPLWNYERIWLPDDDLLTTWSDINFLFHLCRKYTLDLAQPSLLRQQGCYITHEITAQRPDTVLRYAHFIEIMCPVFSARALRLCLGTFRDSLSGFGLDHLWPSILGGPRARMAILDAIGIVHARPLGANYSTREASAEESAMLQAYKHRRVSFPSLEIAGPLS